jgi:filamentous hemagglutinin family protein
MNHIYRLVWNTQTQRYQPAPETANGRGKSCRGKALRPAALVLGAALGLPVWAQNPAANALPTGANVVAGQASVAQNGSQMTVNQGSSKAIIDWNSFNIGSGAAVQFIQPSTSAVALNRVIAGDASQIQGRLSANGQVWLVNPNGVVFGQGSKVDVGGLVASTLNISNEDFLAGKAVFSRNGATSSVVNRGEITAADGGQVALLAPTVRNEGIVRAQLGTVTLAAGDKVTLEAGANGRLQVALDPATVRTLVENKQLIVADGGQVIMTGKAADALSASVVANSGSIQARTLAQKDGRILLLADMTHGETRVAGSLDASAPSGGNGGFIETSAAKVTLDAGRSITTKAASGKTGNWLIDPTDFTIGLNSGDITGRQLSADLASNNVTIQSASGSQAGNGDIVVNAPITWSADTMLTLQAQRTIKVNADISASGNQAGLTLSGNIEHDHGARINLSGRNPLLRMGFQNNLNTYTVVNSLEALQNIGMTGYYALGSNLTAAPGSNANFSPIGNENTKFQGVFDGLGHEISNLRIDGGSRYSVGLFGATQSATIYNLGLVNATIKGRAFNPSSLDGGPQGTGAIVGWANGGSIFNVYAINTQVESASASVGGLVGYLQGARLSNSFITGAVTVTANQDAGAEMVQQIGGLVGLMSLSASISNSYTTANVYVRAPQAAAGSMVGFVQGYGSAVDNSFAANTLQGSGPSGGLIGGIDSDTFFVTNAYYTNWGWSGDNTLATRLSGAANSSTMGRLRNTEWNMDAASALPVLRFFQRDAFVVADDLHTTYGTAAATASYTASGAAVTGGSLAGYQGAINAGSYAITPSGFDFAAGDRQRNGNIFYGTGTLTIDKAPLTITANNSSKTYDGQAWSGTPGVNYSGFVYGQNASVLNGSLRFDNGGAGAINAGSYSITASGLSSSNYAISYVDGSLSISKAPLTITAQNASKTYDGQVWSGSNGVSYSGFVNGENSTQLSGTLQYGGSANAAQNAGSYSITPAGLSSSNYAISYVDGSLSIVPRAITVQVNNQTRAYGDANASSGSLSLSSGALAGNDALGLASVNSLATASSNAGQSYALHASNAQFATGNASNYDISYQTGTLTITPRAISLRPQDISRIYGASNPGSGAWMVATGNLANGDSLGLATLTSNASVTSGAGQSYALAASNAQFATGNAGNYSISYVPGSLTVLRAPLTITAQSASKTYDGLAWAGGNGVSYSGFVAGEDASVLSGALHYGGSAQGARNAGSYHLSASGLASDNYQINWVDGSLGIGKAALTVTARDAGTTYNGQAWSGGNGVTYSGFVNGEGNAQLGGSLVFGGNSQGARNAGSYQLNASGLNSDNYNIRYVPGSLTVLPAPLTITAQSASKTYDGLAWAGGNGVSYSGFAPGEDASVLSGALHYGGSAQGARNAGSYALAAAGLHSANYDVRFVDGLLTLNPAAISITSSAVQKTYDGSTHANGTAQLYSGQLFGTDSLSGGSFVFGDKNAGSDKTVSVSGVNIADGNGGHNYAISYVDNQHSVIDRAALHITVRDAQITTGSNATLPSTWFVLDGGQLHNGETVRQVSLSSTGLAAGAPVGRYQLEASNAQGDHGFDATNYDIRYTPGWLTVAEVPAPQPPLLTPPDGGQLSPRQIRELPAQLHNAVWSQSTAETGSAFLSMAPNFISIEGER